MKIILLSFTLFICCSFGAYQYPFPDNPDKREYQDRRQNVRNALSEFEVYLAFSSDYYTKSDFQTFRQSSDFWYLTGYPHEKSVYLTTKKGLEYNGQKYFDILFIEFQTENDLIWHGKKMSEEQIKSRLGFDLVLPIENLENFVINSLNDFSDFIIAPFTKGKHFAPYPNSKNDEVELNIELINDLQNQDPYKIYKVDKSILIKLRSIKSEKEIEIMQKAINMTCQGHKFAIEMMRPYFFEYQVEAMIENTFFQMGAENVAYNSIVGSGENVCFLHYNQNRDQALNGNLILIDCGAEYHGYAADITRTVPVSGKFTDEQKIIYQIVLDAQKEAIKAAKAGNPFFKTDSVAKDFIGTKLVELNIIDKKTEVRKYFPHGTSHYLGLDVHDVGSYDILEAGNVITIEPGIYIPIGSPCHKKWWNIGIRIEDDILITDSDPLVLSKVLPKEINDIENLIKGEK